MVDYYVRELIVRGIDPAFAADLVTKVYTLGVNSTINRAPSPLPITWEVGNDLNRPKKS